MPIEKVKSDHEHKKIGISFPFYEKRNTKNVIIKVYNVVINAPFWITFLKRLRCAGVQNMTNIMSVYWWVDGCLIHICQSRCECEKFN